PDRRFVTAFVGVIDPATSTIAYQNAGHPPPLLRMPDGTVRELLGRGAPLGLREDAKPGAYAHALPAGSLLVLYTDGLIESTRDILEGERRLHAALRDSIVGEVENPAKLLHDLILVDGSRDDVAILTIAIR
ncbi:MAG: serine/threonine-protein phosphatase, partial [Candidatus Eremiobacteraeota bacterium]|nr:serine/threonine-protein phosphatase [Candidatus Eremiobacteraeota bacterium]